LAAPAAATRGGFYDGHGNIYRLGTASTYCAIVKESGPAMWAMAARNDAEYYTVVDG
jgi:hypothetical protein